MNSVLQKAAVGEMREERAHPGLKWPPSTEYWGDLQPIVAAYSQKIQE